MQLTCGWRLLAVYNENGNLSNKKNEYRTYPPAGDVVTPYYQEFPAVKLLFGLLASLSILACLSYLQCIVRM